MIRALIERFRRPARRSIPPELLTAIELATVAERSPADDGSPRILIRASGLGSWQWSGTTDAADRVARHFPDLPPAACRRAATLVAGRIGQQAKWVAEGKRPQRPRWVDRWRDDEAGAAP
jgi:hypothetical protein